jgi:2-polyprenyl-3-methyl-5-hydroxy-6-metoxy-1,4-benzoquinol methylase
MALSKRTTDEVQTAQRYFGSFADDYHRAFEGAGANPLHRLINKLFRRKTFVKRTEHVETLLREVDVAGKTVLDLGCGSGEVSLVAARLGARVVGIDIVEDMIRIARREADVAGLGAQTDFRVANILEEPVPQADVTMMVGVIEYYSDLDTLLGRVCAATRQRLIICDTRGPWWRRQLRYLLARAKHFYIFYRAPDSVAALAKRHGFRETHRILGHSFTVFAFDRS